MPGTWPWERYRSDSLRWANDRLYGWINKNYKPDGTQYDLYRDGLKIYTTINYKMQQYAEEAVEVSDEGLSCNLHFSVRRKGGPMLLLKIYPVRRSNPSFIQSGRWTDRYKFWLAREAPGIPYFMSLISRYPCTSFPGTVLLIR